MTITEILDSPFLVEVILRATVVGVLVSVCASLLGVCLVMKKYSMIGDGLSHVGYFALAVGAVAGVSSEYSMEVAIPIVILAALLILKLDDHPKISGDAACAIVATGSVAIGTIIFGIAGSDTADICSGLFGSSSVITVTNKDMYLSIALAAVLLTWFVLFYRQIFTVTFDSKFATASGVSAGGLRTVLAVLTAVTIVVGMKLMGAIMISALIVFPAMSASRVCRSFKGVVIMSAVMSVVCFIVGFAVACMLSLQTGAAVVTVELCALLLVFLYGQIRARFRKEVHEK